MTTNAFNTQFQTNYFSFVKRSRFYQDRFIFIFIFIERKVYFSYNNMNMTNYIFLCVRRRTHKSDRKIITKP